MPIHVTTSTTQSLSNKTFVDLLSTTGIVYSQDGDSTQWNSAYTQGNNIKALTGNWENTYTTVNAYSGTWGVDNDSQTLSFNEGNITLSITNGNTISLSALSGSEELDPKFSTWAQANSGRYDSTYTTFNSNSSNYQSVYTTVNTNSSTWDYQGTDIKDLTGNWQNTYTTVSAITGNLILGQLGISIDGAGAVISTGIKQYLRVPYNCTITSYDIVAKPSGNITIDILKSAYEDFPPTTSITGGSSPAITNNIKAQGNPSGWSTTTLTAGEYLGFNVTVISTITAATLTLATRR